MHTCVWRAPARKNKANYKREPAPSGGVGGVSEDTCRLAGVRSWLIKTDACDIIKEVADDQLQIINTSMNETATAKLGFARVTLHFSGEKNDNSDC